MGTTTGSIRNIAIAGHNATGKTTLLEHLLFQAGAIQKPETVESGKTVSDYTDEETGNGVSVHAALAHLEHADCKMNFVDTPGLGDFVGEVVAAFRACETAVMAVGAKAGVQIETIKLWRRLDARNKPRMVFVNKLDEDGADFDRVVSDLGEKFDHTFVPLTIPVGQGGEFASVIDVVNRKFYAAPGDNAKEKAAEVPDEHSDALEDARLVLIEAAAEGNDELLAKFLEEESLTDDELKQGLIEGLRNNKLVPVLCGAGLRNAGLVPLLDAIAKIAPSPDGIPETVVAEDGAGQTLPISADGPFSGFVFKTSIDQFSGKLSFVKVVTGKLSSESELYNARESKKERVNKFYTTQGKKLTEINELVAGDIGVLTKVGSAKTNDTFCSPDNVLSFRPLQLPQPVHSVAIEGAEKKDEDKLGEALHRIVEEDLTFRVELNAETKETVIAGMGELHLNMILDKIKDHQKIQVNTRVPKVAYRETITKSADANYRHKKQSGGHGQFGEVSIKVRPLERGEQYKFDNLIRGMAVSKGYIPGIEKGLQEAMNEGVVAGYPAVDIGTELVDGKEHSVDSSEMAFKMAAKGAMKDAMKKAGPTLLEPVMNLEVFIDEQYLGDVLSDLTSRRGRVQGQESLGGGIIQIKAQVPQAELLRYAIDLRSITSGTGAFEVEFDHYAPISGKIAEQVIQQSAAAE